MSNWNRKLKGTGERYSHDEKTLKNCLSQNGNSLLGFLRRLHFSELEKKKGSHSLAARSDENPPSCRLGWLSYSASGFPTQAVLSERSPENWWIRVVSLCKTPGKASGVPLGVISAHPGGNILLRRTLECTKAWNWPQTNAWDLGRKSKNSMGHDILPACFPEKPLA